MQNGSKCQDKGTLTQHKLQIFVKMPTIKMSGITKDVFAKHKCHFCEIHTKTASASTHKNMLRIPGKLTNSFDFRANSTEKMSTLTFS